MTSTLPRIQRIAAKAVIFNAHGQVLIVREASTDPDNTKIGDYGLPGGRLEPGHGLHPTLLREVHDETGLVVVHHEVVDAGEWYPVIRGVPHQIVGIFYRCELAEDNPEVNLSPEHDDHAWVLPRQRRKYPMMEPDGSVLDGIAKRT